MEMNYADEGVMTSLGTAIRFFSRQRQIAWYHNFRNIHNPQNLYNSILQQKTQQSSVAQVLFAEVCWVILPRTSYQEVLYQLQL